MALISKHVHINKEVDEFIKDQKNLGRSFNKLMLLIIDGYDSQKEKEHFKEKIDLLSRRAELNNAIEKRASIHMQLHQLHNAKERPLSFCHSLNSVDNKDNKPLELFIDSELDCIKNLDPKILALFPDTIKHLENMKQIKYRENLITKRIAFGECFENEKSYNKKKKKFKR